MENLAPSYGFLVYLRHSIENGVSISTSLRRYLEIEQNDFTPLLKKVVIQFENRSSVQDIMQSAMAMQRRSVLELVLAGLNGQPIYQRVVELEEELFEQCQEQIDRFIKTLPFQLMIPLFLFQFPAFLILLLGPLIMQFVSLA